MRSIRRRGAALLVTAVALAPFAAAHAAACTSAGAAPLAVGTVATVEPGAPRQFSLELGAHQGVIVDLSELGGRSAASGDAGETSAPAAHAIRLCDARGNVLAPLPGEVFAKGGSVTTTDDGERLRFYAQAAGSYLIAVDAADAPRELLVRRRDVGAGPPPVIAASLGAPQRGTVSSGQPMVFSFAGQAGQWIELKASSEKDTLLRLAAPDREGAYSVVAENDDSDGVNPMIRRKLPVTGTYFIQVDSLADEPGEFDLTLSRTEAPKPPPPPAPLRPGASVAGKLADGDAVAVYTLPVAAGHSYRLDLTAPYDGVVAIGVPNPVEPEDGGSAADAGFTEIKSQDSGTSGTERLNFSARANGQLLVRVKSFGIGESDGRYTLTASDLGG